MPDLSILSNATIASHQKTIAVDHKFALIIRIIAYQSDENTFKIKPFSSRISGGTGAQKKRHPNSFFGCRRLWDSSA
jgi:hypothetical protein